VPALLWAQQQREKIVIATKTKALQQQIVDHDLPELEKVLGCRLKYSEAKGRENFLCWHKYQNILGGKKRLDPGQTDFIAAILGWAEATRSGDRKELNLNQELMQHWEVIAADRNNCLRELCRYHDKCFRLKMRRGMEKADLIVTNHALLLSDLKVENSILPEYTRLIIDEAHNFSKESFDMLAYRLSLHDTMNLLQILYVKDRRAKKGYLVHLRNSYPHLAVLLDETAPLVENMLKLTRELFDLISSGLQYQQDFNFCHILTPVDMEQEWWEKSLETYLQDWNPHMERLLGKLRELVAELASGEEGSELRGITEALQEIDTTAFTILAEKIHHNTSLTWLDCAKGQATAICAAEVDGSKLLEQRLYQKLRTLVLVSATLTVEESFDTLIECSGLQSYARDSRLETLLEHSPFDYQHQAGLYVVADMPDPGSKTFNRKVNQVLADIFAAQGGQTMVLFTARKQLQEAAKELRPYCLQQGFNLLVQHEDGEFASLMGEFATQENSILMGVETFWEGIDLKGEILKCLVIVKLPFRSPSDPYCSAWERYYGLQRKSGFTHFMLPDAALRFKQGVGRLIRSESDRGSVVVLDTRLVNSRYGAVFRNSIPIKNLTVLPRAELGQHLKLWR
jgi:ATP-dependent DNA helicase DinG